MKKKIIWVFPENFGQKAFMFSRLKENADTECLFDNSIAFSCNIHMVVWDLYIIIPASVSGFNEQVKLKTKLFFILRSYNYKYLKLSDKTPILLVSYCFIHKIKSFVFPNKEHNRKTQRKSYKKVILKIWKSLVKFTNANYHFVQNPFFFFGRNFSNRF